MLYCRLEMKIAPFNFSGISNEKLWNQKMHCSVWSLNQTQFSAKESSVLHIPNFLVSRDRRSCIKVRRSFWSLRQKINQVNLVSFKFKILPRDYFNVEEVQKHRKVSESKTVLVLLYHRLLGSLSKLKIILFHYWVSTF